MIVIGVLLAAGSGQRMGGDAPKQMLDVGGMPMVARAAKAMVDSGVIDELLVVTESSASLDIGKAVQAVAPAAFMVPGGATRAESVRNALASIQHAETDAVIVHDAARPLVAPARFAAVAAALAENKAVTLAIPATDTIVEVEDGYVAKNPDRTRLQHVQTPQGFRLGLLRRAHERAAADADFKPTDDAGVVARYTQERVLVVPGSTRNLKVTTPEDLDRARALLAG